MNNHFLDNNDFQISEPQMLFNVRRMIGSRWNFDREAAYGNKNKAKLIKQMCKVKMDAELNCIKAEADGVRANVTKCLGVQSVPARCCHIIGEGRTEQSRITNIALYAYTRLAHQRNSLKNR